MKKVRIKLGEHPVLNYIRKNVTLNRINEVEDFLSKWHMLDLQRYFEDVLMESIYRGRKGSYKIDYSKARGQTFLLLILFTLFGEPEIPELPYLFNIENAKRIKKVLKKRFPEDSRFLKYGLQYLEVKTGDKNEKTGRVDITPYVYPILGGEIFFYCTLKAIIEISKKVLKDKKYRLEKLTIWKERVADQLISELAEMSPNA